MTTRDDRRSAEAAAYRKLYRTTRWLKIRKAQLAAHPLCRYCQQQGRTTAATICDHEHPHRGDPVAFYAGPFVSLCKDHHDGLAQHRDVHGYLKGADTSGRPVDPSHPWNS